MEVGIRNEFRDREALFDLSRSGYSYSKNKYYGHHSRERSSRRERREDRDRYNDRRRDIRDDSNYSYSNALKSNNDLVIKKEKDRCNGKTKERELGELSAAYVEDNLQPKKKLKFSPIVWDGEVKKEICKVKNEVAPIGLLLPPVAKCSQKSHSVASHNHEQHEEVETATGFSISASRWMDVEEGELIDEEEEDMHEGAICIPTSRSSEASTSSRQLTPELGDLSDHGREIDGKLCKNDDVKNNQDGEDHKTTSCGSDIDIKGSDDTCGILESSVSPSRPINYFGSCRSVYEFEKLKKLGSGTYGVVYQAKDKISGEIVALKKVKMEKEREGFPITSLREINILSSLYHPSIVNLKEVVVEEDVKSGMGDTYLVLDYMEHDLSSLIKRMKYPFSQSEVKCLMLQLFEGVQYLHDNWILHRDLKTSNILLNNCGELKICDFGLSRAYGNPLKPYTTLVISLYYRPPELLLGAQKYSTAIDMWSLGCIMAELLAKKPLFCGKTELDQLDKIFETLGTPCETSWPGFSYLPGANGKFRRQTHNILRKKFPPASFTGSPFLSSAGFDLLSRLLTYDPKKRITAEEAVNHQWFREVPLPKEKEFMPTFPPQHS